MLGMETTQTSQSEPQTEAVQSVPERATAALPAGRGTVRSLRRLQRQAGNRAVGRLLQTGIDSTGWMPTSMPTRQPGDPYEQQADRIADRVINMPEHQGDFSKSRRRPFERGETFQGKAALGQPTEVSPGIRSRTGDIQPSAGEPLPEDIRSFMETRFGQDFSQVRVHTDSRAAASADAAGALAYTLGSDLVFGPGQYAPATPSGKLVLAHELAHTLQQSAYPGLGVQMKKKKSKKEDQKRQIKSVTLLVNVDTVVLEYRDNTTATLSTTHNGKPDKGSYILRRPVSDEESGKGFTATPPISTGTANADGFVVAWELPEDATFSDVESYTFHVIEYRPLPTGDQGKQPGTGTGGDGKGGGEGGVQPGGTPGSEGGKGEGSEGGEAIQEYQGPRLTPEQEAIWREMYELMKSSKGEKVSEDEIAELIRLFQLLRIYVEDPVFGESGENWVEFARFLDQNRDKIEGIMKGGEEGKLTAEKIQKIIDEYGKFRVVEPLEEEKKGEGELRSVKDFEKEFKYDPGWARLSEADRRLLVEYAKMTPGEASKEKIDFTRVTLEMKMTMALKLSDKSLLGEMAQAAVDAFTDPTFIITFILIMLIYVGLWLTPDPSALTKVLAGGLTVVLLAQFAWSDIYGLAKAFDQLMTDCSKAKTAEELKLAGDKFLVTIGPIGFDIILFIVMWRIGKRVGPKVRDVGLKRAIARAEIKLEQAKAQPGAGKGLQATPEAAKAFEEAKAKAADPTDPTSVLDSLAKSLPKEAQTGLQNLRSKAGDAGALKALEGQYNKGLDITHFLTEKGMGSEAVHKARSQVLKTHAALARLKMIEIEAMSDPVLRSQARTTLINDVLATLDQYGILKDPKVQKMVQSGANFQTLVAEIGEAIARAELKADYPAAKGYDVVSNIEVVKEVPGYKTIREYHDAHPDLTVRDMMKFYQAEGKVWESVAEIDAMAVERTAGGKLKPVEMEQVKTGKETHSEASAQNVKVLGALQEIAGGARDKAIFERVAKKKLGARITDQFDLSEVDKTKMTTRGTAGKEGFNKYLYPQEVLEAVAKSLKKFGGLPPTKPAELVTPVPEHEEEPVPAP